MASSAVVVVSARFNVSKAPVAVPLCIDAHLDSHPQLVERSFNASTSRPVANRGLLIRWSSEQQDRKIARSQDI